MRHFCLVKKGWGKKGKKWFTEKNEFLINYRFVSFIFLKQNLKDDVADDDDGDEDSWTTDRLLFLSRLSDDTSSTSFTFTLL